MSDQEQPDQTAADDVEEKQAKLDRVRGTGVGLEDPNIVGDAGPTDVPPGQDPDPGTPEA